ncbi:hypothetical protein CN378_11660 [Bacillus sp. AFS015802]|uniref:hypothetical protein n=1 Tax=Bacillus sp. AFS015802 TaxID=2033486 RepID=UPI000BF875F5|nr:hypothetical protein [Bacillus sp. AFS015802]PFA67035.1 hypothetical protein CN378_11660 [Bacillus sp. AFS015802]
MEEEKKRKKGKVFISILLSSLLAATLSFFIERNAVITKKSTISRHFKQFALTEFNEDVNIVLEKEVGEQYLILYTHRDRNKEKEIGLVRYKKMKLIPLYEFEQYYQPQESSLGTDSLNNYQFIVYGNREELDADYFTYRKNIEFKHVSLTAKDFFIHIETFEDMFLVPRVNFYSKDSGIVASTRAK